MKRGVVIGIAVTLFATYVVASPYVVVHQMKVAAERHDGEALSEHIEFPSVRQSLKDQMNVMAAKKITESEEMKNNPFAAFGAALVGMMVDKMVDAYVTPAGITQLMAGGKPQTPTDTQVGSLPDGVQREPFADASMSYESLNKFVVRVQGRTGEAKFVLRRYGLDWKLADIIIPLE